MHVRDDGSLVVHPVKVPRVSDRVGRAGIGAEGDPWVKPRTRWPVHLIEAPLVIRREAPT